MKKSSVALYLLASTTLLVVAACAPKGGSSIRDKLKPQAALPEIILDAPAKPTVNLPENNGTSPSPYQLPSNKLLTKDNKEVWLGFAQIQNARVKYNSLDKKMSVVGDADILNDQKQKVASKSFSLIGWQNSGESDFSLYDENDAKDKSFLVRGQVNCIGVDYNSKLDCSHVVIDVYISFKDKTYSEQIEAYNQTQVAPAPPATPTKPPPVPPEPAAPSTPPVNAPTPDLQAEDHDQSIDGRYQGSIDTVDLNKLFTTPAPTQPPPPPSSQPAPQPKPPAPVQPPAVPPPPPEQKPPNVTPPPPTTPAPQAPAPVPPKKEEIPAPQKNTTPAPKKLSDELMQTEDGTVRPFNQAVGFPDNGVLRNSTSILSTQKLGDNSKFFEVVVPSREKHYGTYEMAQMVVRTGKFMNEKYGRKLFVGNTSLKNGGKVNPHASHQIGVDIDLGYPTDTTGVTFPVVATMSPHAFDAKKYSAEKTLELFHYLFSQKEVTIERIFVDRTIKADLCKMATEKQKTDNLESNSIAQMFENIQHVDGHGDHFHVRIKCSKLDPSCRSRIYRKMNNCISTSLNADDE